MMSDTKNKNFRVGDKVECILFGVGVVFSVSRTCAEYPVGVNFDGKRVWYTLDGSYFKDGRVTLTKGTWEVTEVFQKVTYKKGELVWAHNGLYWDVYRYDGESYVDDLHHIGSLAADSIAGGRTSVSFCNEVTSSDIRKFKDNPYDIND